MRATEFGELAAVFWKVISSYHSPPPLVPGSSTGVPVPGKGQGWPPHQLTWAPHMKVSAQAASGAGPRGKPAQLQAEGECRGRGAGPGPGIIWGAPSPTSKSAGHGGGSRPLHSHGSPSRHHTCHLPPAAAGTRTSLCWQKPGCPAADPEMSLPQILRLGLVTLPQPCSPPSPCPLWANCSLCLGSLGAPWPSPLGRVFWNLQSMKRE